MDSASRARRGARPGAARTSAGRSSGTRRAPRTAGRPCGRSSSGWSRARSTSASQDSSVSATLSRACRAGARPGPSRPAIGQPGPGSSVAASTSPPPTIRKDSIRMGTSGPGTTIGMSARFALAGGTRMSAAVGADRQPPVERQTAHPDPDLVGGGQGHLARSGSRSAASTARGGQLLGGHRRERHRPGDPIGRPAQRHLRDRHRRPIGPAGRLTNRSVPASRAVRPVDEPDVVQGDVDVDRLDAVVAGVGRRDVDRVGLAGSAASAADRPPRSPSWSSALNPAATSAPWVSVPTSGGRSEPDDRHRDDREQAER